jgi:transposase-like protein
VYRADRELVLVRTQLIHREPALLAAAMLGMRDMQAALATLLTRAVDDALARMVLAGAATTALSAAIEAWQERDGDVPLAWLIQDAFAALEAIRWTS